MSVLHILNGDATREKLVRAGVPGEIAVYADVLHEGPVPAGFDDAALAVRARFLAAAGYGTYDELLAIGRRWHAPIARHADYDAVVLWFEHDLFDQLNLLQILSRVGRERPVPKPVSLVSIDAYPGHPHFKGLGELEPADIAALFERRVRVTPAQLALDQSRGDYAAHTARQLGTLAGLVALSVSLWIATPHFLTVSNLLNVLEQTALNAVVAVGMTFVIISGGIDLSVGSVLAVAGIVLSFPFGVLLALGRRSSFPAVRLVCVAYIELFRGVPLITVLFMATLVVGFFLPPTIDRPSLAARALIGLVLFTAAYVAEIVRGGLQSVPRAQVEAAQSLGLSPLKTTRLVVLPQALRAVIPAMVGQFISLFKDTSLAVIIGLTELVGTGRALLAITTYLHDVREVYVFLIVVYFIFSYTMSSASRRLERRLGLGER